MLGEPDSSAGISGNGFAVTNGSAEGWIRVALAGELDMATAPEVAAALGSVESNGVRSIVLDLSALTFMDVSGLREILASRWRAIESGKEYRIEGSQGIVRRVFTLTGNEEVLVPSNEAGSPSGARRRG